MRAAATMGDYFTAHALTAFDAMGADPARRRTAGAGLARIQPDGRLHRARAVHALPRGDFPAVADLDPALDLLEDHGWIRQSPAPALRQRSPALSPLPDPPRRHPSDQPALAAAEIDEKQQKGPAGAPTCGEAHNKINRRSSGNTRRNPQPLRDP